MRKTDKFHNLLSSLGFEPLNHGAVAIIIIIIIISHFLIHRGGTGNVCFYLVQSVEEAVSSRCYV